MKSKRGHSQEQEDTVLKYVKGNLTHQEREAFEATLQSSPKLQQEVRFIKNLVGIVAEPEIAKSGKILLDLRQEKLQDIRQDQQQVAKKGSNAFTNFIKKKPIVTFFFLLAIILTFLVVNNIILLADCNSLYHKHLKSYPSIFNTSDATRPKLTEAIDAYTAGSFQEAIIGFDTYLDKDPIFRFYATISSLFVDPVNLAQTRAEFAVLRTLFEDDDAYRHLIEWIDYYEALLEFKEGDFKTGRSKIWILHDSDEMDADLKEIIDNFNWNLSRYMM